MPAVSYHWRSIALPPELDALEVVELRAFERLWRRERESLRERQAIDAFSERIARWWSIETGIIERLYELSEGITVQLVDKGFEASLITHGESSLPAEELVKILRDHRESLDFMMDIVGGQRQLSTSWIKELHALLTRHQHTAEGVDSLGRRVEFPLRRGEWKIRPNNPLTSGGTIHEYCPPDQVASEMDRLIELYHSCPPVAEIRAAWLHHAFTQIHPFQDGNGRVARVLASIDFIKAGLFPLLVRREERETYIEALRCADLGQLRPLTNLFADIQQRLVRRAISEYRDWVRLQLRDGGVTDIVVAVHLIGNPSPGAGVAVVFVEHRDLDESTGSHHAPMTVAAEPLLLSADENEQAQRHRFQVWLETARNTALAQWTKFL